MQPDEPLRTPLRNTGPGPGRPGPVLAWESARRQARSVGSGTAAEGSQLRSVIWRAHDAAVADEHALALLVVIMGVGLVLRALMLDAPLGMEEAAHGAAARGVVQSWLPRLPSGLVDVRTPVYHALLGLSFAAGGDSVLTGRLLGVGFGTAAIGAAYVLARRLFDSRGAALLGALLIAIDPLSVVWTARMTPAGLLQLATLSALAAVELQWLGRGATGRWRLGSAAVLGLACLAHPLFAVTLPVVVVVLVARGRRSWGGWRPLLPLVVAAAIAIALPYAVALYSVRRGGATGLVTWLGGAATTLHGVSLAFADWQQMLAARLDALRPLADTEAARAAAALVLGAVAVVGVTLRRGRGAAGMRLVVYGLGTVAILSVAADHRLVPSWAAHLWPLALLVAGGATWPTHGEALSRRALIWLGVAALLGAAAAATRVAPDERYGAALLPLLLGPVLAGAALGWHERAVHGTTGWTAHTRGLLVGAALTASVGLAPLPGGATAGWQQAGLSIAPHLTRGDRVVVHGDQAAVVWWSTGRVDAVVPSWDVVWGVDFVGQPYELVTGAPIAGDLGHLADLLRGSHTLYLTSPPAPPSGPGQAWAARVEAPLDAWLRGRLSVQRVVGPVEVRGGYPLERARRNRQAVRPPRLRRR